VKTKQTAWTAATLESAMPALSPEKPPADTLLRYIDLVGRDCLSDPELAGLAALGQTLGKTAAEIELDHAILAEATRLEPLVAQEAAIRAERDQAAQADAAERNRLGQQVQSILRQLATNDYGSARRTIAAIRAVEVLEGNLAGLGALHRAFPPLFGRPDQKPEPVFKGDLPAAIAGKWQTILDSNRAEKGPKKPS